MRRVSIFGATGSVGQNTLDLIRRASEDYQVVALTGGRNIAQLAQDARAFGAEVAVTAHDGLLPDLRTALEGSGIEAAAGGTALTEAARRSADWVMSAIVGAAGLPPGLAALESGATLALANKETLVCAGELALRTAEAHKATLLPVDSEHSAIFQALIGEDIAAVERIVVTASGGAFRDWPLERLRKASVAEASSHPNWNMGQRITIDSASMFNKALELIETREFFGVSPERIEAVVHRESIIHALVGFSDGALMAHLGQPDMRHPIGFALHWPERKPLPLKPLDLPALGRLTFEAPDPARYPALRLAREVMEARGLYGAAFNGAKERALDRFIAGHIGFMEMAEVVEQVLDKMSAQHGLEMAADALDKVLHIDSEARRIADQVIEMKGRL